MALIDEPNSSKCRHILENKSQQLNIARGSSNNHQAWTGGYLDHITETMNIAVKLFDLMNNLRPLPFSLSDALLVIWLHDIEKVWKYEIIDGQFCIRDSMKSKETQYQFKMMICKGYGIELTHPQLIAIKYIEGEGKDYSSKQRIMNELAAFCHMCDVASARVWYDYGKDKNW